jgi:four helix bundle protein
MSSARKFEDLEIWENGRKLAADLYRVSGSGALARDFGLRDQLRRAAVSVVSNIAEGFERGSTKEFAHFLYLAKGSSGELRSQLYIAFDLGYLLEAELKMLLGAAQALFRQLAAFIRYLEQTPLRSRIKPDRKQL